MPFTLLIDLDDTLLLNPFDRFMPLYIKLLSNKLEAHVSPEIMVPQLLSATDQMIANRTPEKTLEQAFDEHFYPSLGLQKSDLIQYLNEFYLNDFNELQKVTSLRQDALALVDYAVSKEYTIIVATNPLFPQTAMRNRLIWAGFKESAWPFHFVTSFESMHFSKPNPAYYAEILGRFGWPNAPVCMIGNSLNEDILPPSLFGIPGFWVDGDIEKLPDSVQDLSTAGKLDETIPWLEKLEKNPHKINLENPSAVMAVLSSTPAVLQYLTSSLTLSDWKNKPSTDELSILELISHLLDVETEINLPRINEVLSAENPFIVGVDSDVWVEQRNYLETRSPQVISDFMQQRLKCLRLLSTLTSEQWLRPARHSIFGPTSLLELVKFVAAHDIDHIRQVHRLICC